MGTAFLTGYCTKTLGFSRGFVLAVGIGSAVAWALVLFPLLDTGSAAAFVIGMCVTLAIFGMAYGPCGALLPKVFHTRYRCTGAGLGYNLAGVLGVVSFLCTRALVETKDRAL